jgi:superfamily II DNA or RNA helicase
MQTSLGQIGKELINERGQFWKVSTGSGFVGIDPTTEVGQALKAAQIAATGKGAERAWTYGQAASKAIINSGVFGEVEDKTARTIEGIVSFATGGGKTLTAISAIRDWKQKNKPTLVLVPSTLLHKQWQFELRQEIPDVQIISFGAGNRLRGSESIIKEASENSNSVILSTYSTAGKPNFLGSLSKNENLLIIGDEVHTAGRKSFKEFLETDFKGPSMGLSATAERYGDAEGTKRIFDFFGKVLEPIFTIPDAIKAGRLVPYSYEFITVSLDNEELRKWEELSKKISRLIAIGGKQKSMSDSVKRLLIERAKIIKKCKAKDFIPNRIIQQNYVDGDRWLVYCSDQNQMSSVKEILSKTKFRILDFHQNMVGGKDETLEIFSREGGIMLAIKCLDEGVDIPQINKAIILASSSNPREYIQRRGRVLRKTENKYEEITISRNF